MAQKDNRLSRIGIRTAAERDIPSIQELLRVCNLPADDIAEHWRLFLVARQGESIVGTVGLEVREKAALLRSLAVAQSHRGIGLGQLLYRRMIARAESLGLEEIGLLTTTAEKFFTRAGFRKLGTRPIPPYIAASKEYQLFCPSTAVCMTKTLGGPP